MQLCNWFYGRLKNRLFWILNTSQKLIVNNVASSSPMYLGKKETWISDCSIRWFQQKIRDKFSGIIAPQSFSESQLEWISYWSRSDEPLDKRKTRCWLPRHETEQIVALSYWNLIDVINTRAIPSFRKISLVSSIRRMLRSCQSHWWGQLGTLRRKSIRYHEVVVLSIAVRSAISNRFQQSDIYFSKPRQYRPSCSSSQINKANQC